MVKQDKVRPLPSTTLTSIFGHRALLCGVVAVKVEMESKSMYTKDKLAVRLAVVNH